MSKSSPWKDLERRHAKRMNGKRLWRPDFSDSEPDGESVTDVWDCKCYSRFSVVTLFLKAEKKYHKHAAGRRFHLSLFSRDKRGSGDFVLVRAKDYAQLVTDQRLYLEGHTNGKCEPTRDTVRVVPRPDFSGLFSGASDG